MVKSVWSYMGPATAGAARQRAIGARGRRGHMRLRTGVGAASEAAGKQIGCGRERRSAHGGMGTSQTSGAAAESPWARLSGRPPPGAAVGGGCGPQRRPPAPSFPDGCDAGGVVHAPDRLTQQVGHCRAEQGAAEVAQQREQGAERAGNASTPALRVAGWQAAGTHNSMRSALASGKVASSGTRWHKVLMLTRQDRQLGELVLRGHWDCVGHNHLLWRAGQGVGGGV